MLASVPTSPNVVVIGVVLIVLGVDGIANNFKDKIEVRDVLEGVVPDVTVLNIVNAAVRLSDKVCL